MGRRRSSKEEIEALDDAIRRYLQESDGRGVKELFSRSDAESTSEGDAKSFRFTRSWEFLKKGEDKEKNDLEKRMENIEKLIGEIKTALIQLNSSG